MNIQVLQFKLQQVLQANSTKKRKLATTGRLEPSRLAHYKTSKLLFSQPMPNTGKKYKCVFLLDISGSMYWNRLKQAIKVLKNLIKIFYWIIDFQIIWFGATTIELNPRFILSIDEDKLKNNGDFREMFNKPLKEVSINWELNLIQFEWGRWEMGNGTALTPALNLAYELLLKEDWDKFITILTDWEEEYHHFSGCKINWYERGNTFAHKKLSEKIFNDWINILPISIGKDLLSEIYKERVVVDCDNIDKVYEESINFIAKNFWEFNI